jgi:hypothetical protein
MSARPRAVAKLIKRSGLLVRTISDTHSADALVGGLLPRNWINPTFLAFSTCSTMTLMTYSGSLLTNSFGPPAVIAKRSFGHEALDTNPHDRFFICVAISRLCELAISLVAPCPALDAYRDFELPVVVGQVVVVETKIETSTQRGSD